MIWAVIVLAVIAGFLFLACVGLQAQLRMALDDAAGWKLSSNRWKQTADIWRNEAVATRDTALSHVESDTRRVTAIMDRIAREFPVVKH